MWLNVCTMVWMRGSDERIQCSVQGENTQGRMKKKAGCERDVGGGKR